MEIPALAASSDLLIMTRYILSCIFVIFLGELRPPPHIGVPLIGGRKYEGGETSEGGWSIECQPVASILRYDFMLQCFCEQSALRTIFG